MTTITHKSYNLIEVPPLHPKQQEIWDVYFSGKYRNFVINAGRRFGKSTACLAIAIECAVNMGLKVWWVSPTYKLLGNQWRAAKQILKDVYTDKNEVDHRLEFYYTAPDGTELRGELSFRSADKPDNLRGDGIHLLIIDEAAFQSLEVFKVLKPATTDTHGNIIFTSTPNGHNWFYSFFMRGQEDNQRQFPTWWSKHYTSYDNPLLDPKEIDASKKDLTETEFRIEHLAEFIDDIGKVFTNVYACAHVEPLTKPPKPGNYSIGLDLARKHDATVVSVIDLHDNTQVALYRFIGQDWELQKAKIVSIFKIWRPVYVCADATAVGQVVVEDLQKKCQEERLNFKIEAFVLTFSSKPVLIQNLAVKFENKQISILNPDTSELGRIQVNELTAYELRRASKDSMKVIYAAPRNGHDDTVIALALAARGISDHKRVISDSFNFFFGSKVEQVDKPFVRGTEMRRKAYEQQRELLKNLGWI